MAGKIKDSYSFGFQAGSIHSGSISFGRFESEPLSWERRSSFSHNRYLEEVERYSKPGSVNEKKAYFEAHFRKKLLSQRSISDEQMSLEHHSNDHNLSESRDNMEVVQLANKDSQSCHFDESPVSSQYGGEPEVTSNGVRQSRTAKLPVEIDVTIDIVPCEVAAEAEMSTAKGHESNQKEEEVSSQVISLSGNNDTSDITRGTNRNCLPPKVADAVELKPRNVTPKSQPSLAPEDSQKNSSRKIGTPPKTSRERPSRVTSCTATRSVRGMEKTDDKNSQNSKGMPKSRSVGESKGKKFTESSPLAMNKIESRGASTGCRLGRRDESKKPDANQRTRISSFKSNECTEMSKEFYMKSVEKIHAKKVEISRIAARAQERTEAEIKQFRRSLNFKPTPVPSFDHTAGKKSARRAKQTQSLSESPGLLKQSALRSRPHSKPRNQLLSSASDVTKLTGSLNVASNSVSTAGAVNGKKGARTVNVQGATRSSRIMNNEMPRRGIRRPGLSRTGHVAVISVAS